MIHNNAAAQCEHPDYEALMIFYDALDGPNWKKNEDWQEGKEGINCNPCSWDYIGCSADNRVVYISIISDDLKGMIPDIQMDKLEILEILDSDIFGLIPNFSGLPLLEKLSIRRANLEGSIPDFSKLPNLKELNLFVNNFTGEIPDFSMLEKLETLDISANQLEGKIVDFKNLPNLISLNISSNELSGSLLDFTNLPKLENFIAAFNKLSGPILDFKNMPNLKGYQVQFNNLTGGIPNFKNMLKLNSLMFFNNSLEGQIPTFENLASLSRINISNNKLSGTLPSFENALLLTSFSCGSNHLTGTIPDYSFLSELNDLSVNHNLLSGCYPNYVCDIIFSAIGNNMLPEAGEHQSFCVNPSKEQIGSSCGGIDFLGIGIIQDDCSCLIEECEVTHPAINALISFYNALDGDNWTNNRGWKKASEGFICDPCHRDGKYGGWYGLNCNAQGEIVGIDMDGVNDGALQNLEGNNLKGTLPVLNFPALKTLSLTGNNISGPLPDLNLLPSLERFGLTFNNFTGPFPDFSGNPHLRKVRASYNKFEGVLPDFTMLPDLNSFTASNNLLTGCYPEGICNLNLFSVLNNVAMPWQGDHENLCLGMPEIGAPCLRTDGTPGIIDDNCECEFVSSTTTIELDVVLLSPNPVQNELHINGDHNCSSYTIFNSSGRIIQQGEIGLSKINISSIPSGLYILKLNNLQEQPIVKRFIKI